MAGHQIGLLARKQRRYFITQAEQATRFQANDWASCPRMWQQRIQQPPGLRPSLLDQTGSQKGSAATQRPTFACSSRNPDGEATGLEHPHGGS